jgi:hypothetical protein
MSFKERGRSLTVILDGLIRTAKRAVLLPSIHLLVRSCSSLQGRDGRHAAAAAPWLDGSRSMRRGSSVLQDHNKTVVGCRRRRRRRLRHNTYDARETVYTYVFFSTTPIYQSPDFCSPFSESLKRAASQLLESD